MTHGTTQPKGWYEIWPFAFYFKGGIGILQVPLCHDGEDY